MNCQSLTGWPETNCPESRRIGIDNNGARNKKNERATIWQARECEHSGVGNLLTGSFERRG
ncbi:hypothetical protein GCM10007071_09620 [Marinobacter zhanjiangensis]|uniref:Uncharacterized protein n=1 Tax=Marinobacter zhanjiangensis TaxID=578215 RepID=A0ABQ3AQZ5_9GAMM|nr:hypothetical protein GCM10007071_09620 [Marinobacter zhanjiangensis]